MLLKRRRGWELPERAATPEPLAAARARSTKRRFVKGLLLGAGIAVVPGVALRLAWQDWQAVPPPDATPDPSRGRYPVARNAAYQLDRPLTAEHYATAYNNFYEFGAHKTIAAAAQALPIRPWQVVIDGLVEQERTFAVDELLARLPLEERLYRHRCVEAWAMAVPWSGFPLAALVALARPLGSARYVRFATFHDPEIAAGQRSGWYAWPYVEGLTMAEATHDLAFIATGLYGKPLPRQNGAPLRLVVPWKYGFKSIKSVVRITFTKQRPRTFWEQIQPAEYGFWANVNPAVPHPRWSQASERLLGTDARVPTRLFNGYGEHVAHLYQGLGEERLFV